MNKEKVSQLIRELLIELGEDPDRQGLRDTPSRAAKSWDFLSSGYRSNLKTVVNNAVFESEANNMIICRDIELYSLCEHHLLPFYGTCTIAYIANHHVIGISKLARIVDLYSRRLQLQERLTAQIAKAVQESVSAIGVGVIVEAKHMCMLMRGVQKEHSMLTTSSVLGRLQTDPRSRNEFLNLVKK